MARAASRFLCQSCGAASTAWEGRCHVCGTWDSLVETVAPATSRRSIRAWQRVVRVGQAVPRPLREVAERPAPRLTVGIGEVDRVLGGGLVPGALVLLGGEPGIGKSTLVLEIAAGVARCQAPAPAPGGRRHRRAVCIGRGVGGPAASAGGPPGPHRGVAGSRIQVLAETDLDAILVAAEAIGPGLLVVDSVQTLTTDGLEGPAGSVGQVRESAARLAAWSHEHGTPVVLVGHVTKDGSLAGPRTLEHLVDVVLDPRRRPLWRAPPVARRQEPLWVHGGDRRPGDDRRRPSGRARPGARVPGRGGRGGTGGRRRGHPGRHPAASWWRSRRSSRRRASGCPDEPSWACPPTDWRCWWRCWLVGVAWTCRTRTCISASWGVRPSANRLSTCRSPWPWHPRPGTSLRRAPWPAARCRCWAGCDRSRASSAACGRPPGWGSGKPSCRRARTRAPGTEHRRTFCDAPPGRCGVIPARRVGAIDRGRFGTFGLGSGAWPALVASTDAPFRAIAGRQPGAHPGHRLTSPSATGSAFDRSAAGYVLLLVLAGGVVHRRLLGPAPHHGRAGAPHHRDVTDLSAGEFVAAIIGLTLGLLLGFLLGLPLSNFPDPQDSCCPWASRWCSGWA